MASKGKCPRAQEIHRTSASKHDLYSAMGATAGFDEAFEPEVGDEFTAASSVAPAAMARFQLLYESRDGKVAVFEDERGHIVAVNAKRLA